VPESSAIMAGDRPEWLVWLPGVIPGFHFGCAIAPGEVIVTHTPVYPPFLAAPANVGKRLRAVDLVCAKGRWVHDEAAMVAAFAPGDVGALLLCHPHNPTGGCGTKKNWPGWRNSRSPTAQSS